MQSYKEEELIELSKRVAEKLGIDEYLPSEVDIDNNPYGYKVRYLHEDSARCFDLMCEHDLMVEPGNERRGFAVVRTPPSSGDWKEYRLRHNGDKSLATRVAILKALDTNHD